METLVTKKVSIVLRLESIMEIRDRIIEKANELFMQFGIRSVSMDDIANGLGMSKKTLYQHFADKDELVMAVVVSPSWPWLIVFVLGGFAERVATRTEAVTVAAVGTSLQEPPAGQLGQW